LLLFAAPALCVQKKKDQEKGASEAAGVKERKSELMKESERSLLSPVGKSEQADSDDQTESCDTYWPVRRRNTTFV